MPTSGANRFGMLAQRRLNLAERGLGVATSCKAFHIQLRPIAPNESGLGLQPLDALDHGLRDEEPEAIGFLGDVKPLVAFMRCPFH